MLASVNLDDEPSFEANEIHDVAPQHVLALIPATERASPQALPQGAFVRRHLSAQLPRAIGHDGAAGVAERRRAKLLCALHCGARYVATPILSFPLRWPLVTSIHDRHPLRGVISEGYEHERCGDPH